MMLFPKEQPNTAEQTTLDAAAVARMKRQMRRQILLMALCLAVVGIAAFAFASRAWYAMNTQVISQDSNVVSDSMSPSLFIGAQSDNTKVYASSIAASTGASLFPISTINLSDWYYASGFAYNSSTQTQGGYTYTINTPIANAYTRISSFIDADAGTYNNTYEDKTRTAYYCSKVNLYTVNGDLDVYLNETNPITVAYDTTNQVVAKRLLDALRVGIYAGGSMKLIYAPLAESGTGNSQGSVADTFYAISGGTLTSAASVVKTSSGLTDYLAGLKTGSTVLFEENSQTPVSIGTATDTTGLDVTVYVWLEGTDAQALFGLSDDDLKGISVSISYVGVDNSGA